MKRSKFISAIEWQVLKVLWRKKQASVKEVWQEAYPKNERAYTTIQTYMDRMVEKKVLKKEKIGLVNFYQALVSEEQALFQATESLVSRAFNGSFGTLAAFLVDSRHLTKSDLETIKRMIEQKEKGMKQKEKGMK